MFRRIDNNNNNKKIVLSHRTDPPRPPAPRGPSDRPTVGRPVHSVVGTKSQKWATMTPPLCFSHHYTNSACLLSLTAPLQTKNKKNSHMPKDTNFYKSISFTLLVSISLSLAHTHTHLFTFLFCKRKKTSKDIPRARCFTFCPVIVFLHSLFFFSLSLSSVLVQVIRTGSISNGEISENLSERMYDLWASPSSSEAAVLGRNSLISALCDSLLSRDLGSWESLEHMWFFSFIHSCVCVCVCVCVNRDHCSYTICGNIENALQIVNIIEYSLLSA